MKYVVTLFLCLGNSKIIHAQNLVPNPSFEDTLFCPIGTNQIEAATNWMNFGNSPDYFNACSPLYINVPNSQFGFQYAHTGVAMAGLGTYRIPSSPDGPNYREIIGIPLLNSLQSDVKYYLSFFVNFAFGPSVGIAANKIGCRFSNIPYSEFYAAPIDNYAVLFSDSILIDSVQWYKLSGSFVADSSYSYLMIGNFFQDSLTDTLIVGPFPDYSYYYIDDVCVTTDSSFNESWTGITEPTHRQFETIFYPNPTSDILNIKSRERIEEIIVTNCLGQIVFSAKISSVTFCALSLGTERDGIYMVKVKTKDSLFTSLVNLIH